MKLSIRIAGICASGTFILTALPGFYQHTKPSNIANMANEAVAGMSILETMMISLAGAFAAAFIGYVIGDILANPKGNPKKKKKDKALAPSARQLTTALDDAMASGPIPVDAVPSPEPAAAEES